jgi:ketosteroid isomerase-like protein
MLPGGMTPFAATAAGSEAAALAGRFFDAIEHGDVDAVAGIYRSEAVVWHNDDGVQRTREQNLAVLRGFIGLSTTRQYLERRCRATADGFVHQHVLVATHHHDGRRLELPACVVCSVAHGQITRLDEYYDPAPVRAWLAGKRSQPT